MQLKITVLFFLQAFLPFAAFSQAGHVPAGMPFILLSTYGNKPDVMGVYYNQAALAGVGKPAAVFFAENKYLMEGQQLFAAAVQYPMTSGNAAMILSGETSGMWSRKVLGLAMGRRLGALMDVGVQFNMVMEKISGRYGRVLVSGDAGVNFHPVTKLTAGIHFSNPSSFFKASENSYALPAVISCGIGYEAGETFYLSAVMRSTKGGDTEIWAGFEYRHANRFFLRGGFNGLTGSYFIGPGLVFKSSRIDISFGVHPRLGISSGLQWTTGFNKKVK